MRPDQRIALQLPAPTSRPVAASRSWRGNRTAFLHGPEAWPSSARTVGKTTLLEALVHGLDAGPGRAGGVLHTDRFGYLTQRLDGVDETVGALGDVSPLAPDVPDSLIRNRLGRLLLKGDDVDRPVGP